MRNKGHKNSSRKRGSWLQVVNEKYNYYGREMRAARTKAVVGGGTGSSVVGSL